MLTGAAKLKMTMTDSREYRAFWTKFIEIYRENPCLWKVGSKDYADRTKKNQAYQMLVDKLREIDEYADRETAVKKINSLRSSFRKEAKKVTASLNSGSGPEDAYTPSLWYYGLLLFLYDPEMPQKFISNIEEDWVDPHEDLELSEAPENSGWDTSARRSSVFSESDKTFVGTPTRRRNNAITGTDADSMDAVLALMEDRQGPNRREDEFDAIGSVIMLHGGLTSKRAASFVMKASTKRTSYFGMSFQNQENPCLWKVGSKEYADRNKKGRAYQLLVDKLREVDEYADRETVLKKINNLRSNFRKEAKKVAASITMYSGSGGSEDVYTPSLWYYHLLSFLYDPETQQKPMPNFNESWADPIEESESSEAPGWASSTRPSSAFSESDSIGPPKRKMIKTLSGTDAESVDSVLALVEDRPASSRREDEFDAIGKNVAAKFRRMPNNVRIIAEKVLNDVLFQAEMGFLKPDARIISEADLYSAPPANRINGSTGHLLDEIKLEQ
ncbi:MADF domain [Trinorchestia longiramus]|nr:MADF domain [Trinorchestia longiramus]